MCIYPCFSFAQCIASFWLLLSFHTLWNHDCATVFLVLYYFQVKRFHIEGSSLFHNDDFKCIWRSYTGFDCGLFAKLHACHDIPEHVAIRYFTVRLFNKVGRVVRTLKRKEYKSEWNRT
jgi:hypothetical protein